MEVTTVSYLHSRIEFVKDYNAVSGRQFQTSDVASFGIRSFRMVFKKKLADLWIFPFSQER